VSALLRVAGLRKSWRSARTEVVAVNGVDLEVHRGEVVGLIGESGCGKTTLARTAMGLWPRDAGTVEILGEDPAVRRRPPRRAQMLFQDAGASLNPGLSVRQTLAESARVHAGGRRSAVDEALDRVGLATRADARPAALSGGEKRRATLAQLAIADPLLVVADEPTAGLDAARKADLLDLLLSRKGPDRGYLIISHDLPLVLYCCDRVLVMHAGRVVDAFASAGWRAAQHPLTRALLHAAGMVA
jgi:ABC-type glutathione transport system ATPase component